MEESEASLKLFKQLNSFSDIKKMIDEGETEDQYIECKAPSIPKIDRGLKVQLSEAISGFGNSGGGIIIWGVSTTHYEHSGLDVLSQPQPIGSIKKFAQEIDLTIPRLISPSTIKLPNSKILLEKYTDTKGVAITYIPAASGDPIQANDGKFYLRIKNEFKEMPYETIKRMFSGSNSPDLYPRFDNRIVKLQADGSWKIPITIENKSSAAAKDVKVSVTFKNSVSCENIQGDRFRDSSEINPGKKIFITDEESPIHRGMDTIVGYFNIRMKKIKRNKRILKLLITIFATNMRARVREVIIELAKKGFSVKNSKDNFLY